MTFIDLAHQRSSVRAFESQKIPSEALERALEAARLAPSACNVQPWHFVVIDEPALREQVAQACRGPAGNFNRFVPQAPLLVAVVQERGDLKTAVGGFLKRRRYSSYDVGMAAEHFCLQAAEDGVGTCMLGWFNERKTKRLLHVPRRLRVALVIAVGFPVKTHVPGKRRKEIGQIVSRNRYTRNTDSPPLSL